MSLPPSDSSRILWLLHGARAQERAIPADPSPERTLERFRKTNLEWLAEALGRRQLAWRGKDALVRSLGHLLRDPGALQPLFEAIGTRCSLLFLADLVIAGRMPFDELPTFMVAEFAELGLGAPEPSNGCELLYRLALVCLGRWKKKRAVYVPDDVRRPYAEALLAITPSVCSASMRHELEALIQRTSPPRAPYAPGYPTGRARRRLATPGPDRVLELHVHLLDLDVPVWRRLLVSYQRPLGALHEIIRIAFGWPQRGSHWFIHRESHTLWGAPGRQLGRSDTENEWKSSLRDVIASPGSRALYVIDPPTHWVHEVATHKVHAPEMVPGEPYLLDAYGVHPPPDLGNHRAYGEFRDAWRRGKRSRYLMEFVGPDFDPDAPVDIDRINRRLELFG